LIIALTVYCSCYLFHVVACCEYSFFPFMYFTFVRIHQQRTCCQSLKAKKLGPMCQLQGMRGIRVPDILEIYQMTDTRLTASF